MRIILIVFSIISVAACAIDVDKVGAPTTSGNRPNIVVLMAEDMGARVAAFGDSLASTPHIDALAASGVRYPNSFTTAGVCAPSRAAHITGMHQIAVGAQHMRTSFYKESPYRSVPPSQVKAYPEVLRRAGYYTFTNRKLDYQFSSYAPGSGPFTIWDDESADPDWSGRAPDQPFFGLVNLPQTHESQLFTKNFRRKGIDDNARVVPPGDVTVPPYYADTPSTRETISRLYENIREMDNYVGQVLAQLEADGLLENTIVIWTTDHGDGLPRAKREIYDSGIKVPLLVSWPDRYRPDWVTAGGVDERLISFVDIGASVLEIAGVSIPDYMHGRPTLVREDTQREYVFASKDRTDGFAFRERAVRDGRYKYIRNYRAGEPGAVHIQYRDQLEMMAELWDLREQDALNIVQSFWFGPRPAEELYDIQADPHETRNLADDVAHEKTLARMRGALDNWLEGIDDHGAQPEIEMALRFWPDGQQPVTPVPVIRPAKNGAVIIDPGEPGASIGYRFDNGPWRVYAPGSELMVAAGALLGAKSVRYGWQESPEVTFRSEPSSFRLRHEEDLVLLGDNEAIDIAISPAHGGELAGFRVAEAGTWRELIYRARDYGEHTGWRGKAPILWPATGVSIDRDGQKHRYILDGESRNMPQHGFARSLPWYVSAIDMAADEGKLTLSLRDSVETRTMFPFGFNIDATYAVSGSRLTITYQVSADEENSGDMPFSIGNHVSFRLPLIAGSDASATRFVSGLTDRYLTDDTRVFTGEIIASPYVGGATVAELPRRRAVSIGGADEAPSLVIEDPSGARLAIEHTVLHGEQVEAVDFNLWADVVDGFFCPEPWVGTQNSLNTGVGLVHLGPGQDWRWQIRFEYENDSHGDT